MEMNNEGRFVCSKCGSKMDPMTSGKGWKCSSPDNRFVRGKWTHPVVWNKQNNFFETKKVARPATFPVLKNPTGEQDYLLELLGTHPRARKQKSRLIISNAGPGCAKTTTTTTGCHRIFQRAASEIDRWWTVAFNTNARDTLEEKLPSCWMNVSTINAFGGRMQGFSFKNYKKNKVNLIFNGLIDHLPDDEKPSFGGCKAFVDRMRDQLIYGVPGDKTYWVQAISYISQRFPALAKILQKEFTEKIIKEYVPELIYRCQADSSIIDLTEQYCRPVTTAIQRMKWQTRWQWFDRNYEWDDTDISHLCNLIRNIDIPNCNGIIVDEAQDLSLSQICLFLAATWRQGELILIGDDRQEEPFRAGQAIFGWRGAFSGSLEFISRLWNHLTGEPAIQAPLTISFRCPPEVVEAVKPLNQTLKAAKPKGTGEVWSVSEDLAFTRWCNLSDDQKSLWITRKNAPLAKLFLATIKDRKKVCLRGGSDFMSAVDRTMYEAIGWYDKQTEEYKATMDDLIDNLTQIVSEERAESNGDEDPDSLSSFILDIAEEISNDPSILIEAELEVKPTPGNVRRFLKYFSTKDANRVLTTIYRAKGDEADLVVISDCESFGQAWNGDEKEMQAVCHTAATRSKQTLLVCGAIPGVIANPAPVEPEEVKPKKKSSPRKKKT